MRSYKGILVGRKYKTHREVWLADDELRIGLLHLIVDRLEDALDRMKDILNDKPIDMMLGHQVWLTRFQKRAEKAIFRHKKECLRISKFCDIRLLGVDVKFEGDIHKMSKVFRSIFAKQAIRKSHVNATSCTPIELLVLESKVNRLKRVKSIEDIEELYGIGKRKAESIRTKILNAKRCENPISGDGKPGDDNQQKG